MVSASKIRILLVEDNHSSQMIVESCLTQSIPDLELLVCESLEKARQSLKSGEFDLVLVDLGLPDGNGLELVQEAQRKGLTQRTPFLIVTVRTALDSMDICYKSGAHDYIEKPFHPEELRCRVHNALEAMNSRKFLMDRLDMLERYASAGLSVSSAYHDLRNVFSGTGLLNIIHDDLQNKEKVEFHEEGLKEKLSNILQVLHGNLELGRTLVDNLPILYQKDEQRIPTSFQELIEPCLNLYSAKIENYDIQVLEAFDPEESCELPVFSIQRILINLIGNSIDAIMKKKEAVIKIELRRDGRFLNMVISDNGPGIAEEIRERIFHAMFTTKEQGKESGLGLFIVKSIVHRLDGAIQYMPGKDGGASFLVDIPLDNS